jgi:hypothetical protein
MKTMDRVKSLPIEKKTLILAEVFMAGLCLYRFLSYVITGFFVSDEYGYFYNAANGTIYGDRWFFGWLNVILFDVFNIKSPDSFAYFLPFYLFVWGGLTIFVFYRLLKLLDFKKATVAISVVCSFVLVSFVLLSVGFLTEGVGLCMAMLGTYFLVRFLKSGTVSGRVASLLLGALFLGFAGGTREPYVAMEIGAIALVLFAAVRHPMRLSGSRYGPRSIAALSILVFLVPTGLMLYANTATTSTVAPIAASFVESLFTNPANSVATATVSVTNTGVFTQNVTQTQTIVQNSTTSTVTVTTQSVETTTSVVAKPQTTYVPFYGKSLLLNTAAIFVGGIILGWGPIAFPIALIGFVILTKSSVRRDPIRLALLILVISALGSDLIVSYIFAPIPNYLTFQNYSTIIRFSGTALPAFFLSAPFFLDVVAKNKKRVVGLFAIIAVALLILVPVYQVYAISNLGYTTVSPFGLDYRSPAVQVRDYVNTHQADAPFEIIGVPYGWYFTPGIDGLRSVYVYSPSSGHTLSPTLNYTAFLAQHWTEFYVYSSTDFIYEEANSPYVLQFIPGAPVQSTTSTNQTTPFTIVNSTVVIRNPDWLLTEVYLSWQSTGA